MDLNSIKSIMSGSNVENIKKKSTSDVAIIGVNAKVGDANDYECFWNMLSQGLDFIRTFPESRRTDANKLNLIEFGRKLGEDIAECAYLNAIDEFDADFFHITATVAELMDPMQRMFLESAWHTFEDAGYTKKILNESKTGVYIGYNGMGSEYGKVMNACEPEKFGVAVSGNVSGMVASRISYHLNLRGPAINIDTACSSSLVAMHIACEQLNSGEIKMALVGGIHLMPTARQVTSQKMGIESSSQRTKTFDSAADGTGSGEGVISILLKPLNQAIRDNDQIYAVIKGSSINQDGASVGITAPNAAAQEEVICQAWRDAGVNPETISYIEAHGTATNLGDPVEINGIKRAFRHYTDKKQFCAIGSVKSNIGHLDSSAGIAGVLKCILMMKYKMLPPTLHFNVPNPSIEFIDSPVYVNDKLEEWIPECGVRRCGVSAFGMSGTNCHMVLEEAPSVEEIGATQQKPGYMLCASAKEKETVVKVMKSYQKFLSNHKDVSLEDFCYTANAGRNHYNCRLGIFFENRDEFLKYDFNNIEENDAELYYYNEYKSEEKNRDESDSYVDEKREKLSIQADKEISDLLATLDGDWKDSVSNLLELYVNGAEVDWDRLYTNQNCKRISIPVYPFKNTKYWFQAPKTNTVYEERATEKIHPLIDRCVLQTYHMKVYEKLLSPETCWELKYHKINGVHVFPGTALIEALNYIIKHDLDIEVFEIQDLIYLVPLACHEHEERLVHIIIKEDSDISISLCSREIDDKEWVCNVEAKIAKDFVKKNESIDIDEVKKRCPKQEKTSNLNKLSIVEINGEQWDNLKNIYCNEDELLLEFQLDPDVNKYLKDYYLYPPLLDPAINGGNFVLNAVHLPYYFKKARFYEQLPTKMYSYLRRREENKNNEDLATFDIVLCATDGRVIGELDEYSIKRVIDPDNYLRNDKIESNMYHEIQWVESDSRSSEKEVLSGQNYKTAVFMYQQGQSVEELLKQLKDTRRNIIKVVIADKSKQLADDKFQIENTEDGFISLVRAIDFNAVDQVIQVYLENGFGVDGIDQLHEKARDILSSAFMLVKTLVTEKIHRSIEMIFLTKNASCVTGKETNINPISQSLIGFTMCIEEEYTNLKTRVIDSDEFTSSSTIVNELDIEQEMFQVAFRNGKRYVPKMVEMNDLKEAQPENVIKENGTYIISGGAGGMGLAFCQHLCDLNMKTHVILLNRTYSQEDVEEAIKRNDTFSSEKLAKIVKMCSDGMDIEVLKADVTDIEKMKSVMRHIKQKYGQINGVVHTAGVPGDGFIFRKDWSEFESVIAPKIYGTWILSHLTKEEPLDFFSMCSSYASVFGSAGQSDYIAANAFLDSFTYYRKMQGLVSTTINWTGWSESGMAFDSQVDEAGLYTEFVNNAEGVKVFMISMESKKPRVLLGKLNYSLISQNESRYTKKVRLPKSIMKNKEKIKDVPENSIDISEIEVLGKQDTELTEVEKNVIYVWAKTLGVNRLNVNDKFFELGADSLLASYLQKEMNKIYPNVMAITDVFTYSTILEMADFIDHKVNSSVKKKLEIVRENKKEEEGQDIEALLTQFMNGAIDRDKLEELLD